MKTIRVAAAVIRDGLRLFAAKRGYGEYKGFWEFPGGKIEEGETPQEALKREIYEELDTEIEVGNLIQTIEYDYPEFHLSMDCFWCRIVSGELTLREASDSKWMDRVDLVRERMNWTPADWKLVDELPKTLWDDAQVNQARNEAHRECKELMSELLSNVDAGKYEVDLRSPGPQAAHSFYQEIALELIRSRYPEADDTCFSFRYGIMDDDKGRPMFINHCSSWEYPGHWYPNGSFKTTGAERIEELVEEGLFRFKVGRKGRYSESLYEF